MRPTGPQNESTQPLNPHTPRLSAQQVGEFSPPVESAPPGGLTIPFYCNSKSPSIGTNFDAELISDLAVS